MLGPLHLQLFLYPASSSLPVALYDFIKDTLTQAGRATSTTSREKNLLPKREGHVAVLAGGKIRRAMPIIRSKSAKPVQLYYLALRERRLISNKQTGNEEQLFLTVYATE